MSKKTGQNNRPRLSDDTAEKLLANIFDSAGQEPNTVPLPQLAAYGAYRRERYSFQKVLLLVVMVIFCLLPLCFFAPEFTVEINSIYDDRYPTYFLTIDSKLPVWQVAASLDGQGLYVSEEGERLYSVTPTENGELSLRVTLINRQYDVKLVTVSGVDAEAPTLLYTEKSDTALRFFLADEGLGVDWEGIYALTDNGEAVLPTTYDTELGCVYFDLPTENLNLYIPDLKGNVLQLLLSI